MIKLILLSLTALLSIFYKLSILLCIAREMILRANRPLLLSTLLVFLAGCSGEFKEVVFFSEWYSGEAGYVAKFLPILVFLLSFALSLVINGKIPTAILLVILYINLSFFAYLGLDRIFLIESHGQYFLYSLQVFVRLFLVYAVCSLIYRLVQRKKVIETMVIVSLVGSVIFMVSVWVTSVYKMGAGYCLKTGRQITYLGVLNAISEFEKAKFVDSTEHPIGSEVSVEQLAKSVLQEIVEYYELGKYEEAISALPDVVGYPAGQVKWAEDVGWRRMYRSNTFKQITMNNFHGSSKKVTYYISNCGEVERVFPVGYD